MFRLTIVIRKGWGIMGLLSLEELVRQSEKEGITLGELLARTASAEDLDAFQAGLSSQIKEGYASIEDFMSDIEITSVWNLIDEESPDEEPISEAGLTLSDD